VVVEHTVVVIVDAGGVTVVLVLVFMIVGAVFGEEVEILGREILGREISGREIIGRELVLMTVDVVLAEEVEKTG
jgi:hypothetical protein